MIGFNTLLEKLGIKKAVYEMQFDIAYQDHDNIHEAMKDYLLPGLDYEVLDYNGPGGGWPIVRVFGPLNSLKQFALEHYIDDSADDILEMYGVESWEDFKVSE